MRVPAHPAVRPEEGQVNDPKPDGIHVFGTIGTIIQMLRLPDGTVKVLVEGQSARRSPSTSRRRAFRVNAGSSSRDGVRGGGGRVLGAHALRPDHV